MLIFIQFFPMILFVLLYVGSGLYFTFQGVENAFYQISPTVAIIPALILAWVLRKGSTQNKMDAFIDGARHRDIITMCFIFLLAGAFSTVTSAIGSVDATVNVALALLPARFLLIGIFIAGAFISTAIGSALGTIATLAPIAVGLAEQGAFPMALGMGTVVGAAMFGDNLSLISDTTIAAVLSQHADFRKKLKLNCIVASIAAVITMALLYWAHASGAEIAAQEHSLILVVPYLALIALAVIGINVFVVLIVGLLLSACIGFATSNYSLIALSADITSGFASMYDIMLLSMLVGALSGLVGHENALLKKLEHIIPVRGGKKLAQLLIGSIVSVCDLLLANNTVSIVFCGDIARNIAQKYRIPAHCSAAWLDVFSCVMQGIIPHGAQVLLASSLAGISPLAVASHVYYCYVLGLVTIVYIVSANIEETECE